MTVSMLPFEPERFETREANAFIYEPLWNEDKSLRDFRIVYASEVFARDWRSIYHNDHCVGALLQEESLMSGDSIEMMKRFLTEKPHPFATYMPMLEMHLQFEPIPGLPAPYAGFYITVITDSALRDAKDHFLKNIQQMKNNAVLMQRHEDGRMEPVFVSAEFARMMECSVAEAKAMMTGIGFFKTTAADDRPLVRSMMERRVAYDGGSLLTIQKITARHNKVWCNVHYAFIDDFDEHYVYCTYMDVTALKEYEERLRSTYSSLGSSFYQVNDKTLVILRANLSKNVVEEIKGADRFDTDSLRFSYADLIRYRAAHFPISSEQTQFLKRFDRERLCAGYAAGTTNVSMILYSVRKDGRSCFVNFSASITRHPLTGDVVAFMTEQECNSKKVKDTLIGKILAEQFDMVAYLTDGRYGVTIGDAAKIKYGSIFPITLHGDYQTYLDKQVAPALAGDEKQRSEVLRALRLETVEAELRVREPYVVNVSIEMEGETYYKQFDFYSIDPEARFYILLKRDTTEIQKEHMALNEQLRLALEAANQANVAKTAFLSNMSHEIRTPMNAIIGLDSIALKAPDLPEKTREQLEKIGSSARHLLKLINDILDMSRIESGRLTIRNEEFSFAEVLTQINTMIHSQCQDRGLHYDARVIGDVDEYYIGDDMKLKQVLINILGNAVKFTPAPGTVSFLVERTAVFDGQSTLRFIIRDTGIGMDPEYLPKIFDAFSQEDENKANKYGSTGLGMAITKNIVEMMNGTVSVESEKGVGSTFTVSVTLRNSERIRHEGGAIEAQELKVLVVDDDIIAREHAITVLEEIGIAADTADSGKAAMELIQLKAARHDAYNLIIVDWKMPEQDGVELTREIRRLVSRDTVMIVLTGYDWEEIEQEARLAGVDSFMSKPLFAADVLSTLHAVLDNRRAAAEKTPTAELAGRRILIAEDIPLNAEILADLLEMQDMSSEHAENGRIAVDMFSRSGAGYYDAILMDVRMPVMDGLSAAQAIRALNRPDAKTIPIIAMTANAFDEDVQRSLQAGMNAHLTKPVESDRLYETLGELIRA